MTRQRREKSKTEKELIDMLLARQITTIGDSFKHDEKSIKAIREYYWKVLSSSCWQEAKQCLASLRAIVSCALEPDSILYEAAHYWLAKKLTKDQDSGFRSFLTAIVLQEANYSLERRSRILDDLVDRYALNFNGAALDLWQDTRNRIFIGWEKIKSVINSDFQWSRWPIQREGNGMLSESSEKLFWACYWVMENPRKENIKGIVQTLLEHPLLENTPKLRKQIIEVSLLEKDTSLIETLSTNYFSIFIEEIVEVLINPVMPNILSFSSQDEEKKQYFEKLFPLAKLFVEIIENIEKENRGELVEKLLQATGHPWIFNVADELCLFGKDSDKLPQFLLNYIFPSQGHQWSGCRFEAHQEDIFEKALLSLSEKNAACLLNLFLLKKENYNRLFNNCLESFFFKNMKDNPEIYQQALSKTISLSKCSIGILLNYLDAIGIEKAKNDLVGWLYNRQCLSFYDREESDLMRLFTDYIIPHKISVGRLLPPYTKELLSLGYQLCPKDVDNSTKVLRILPSKDEYGTRRFTADSIVWQNESFRKTLLTCGHSEELSLRSLLITARDRYSATGNPLDWLEQVLIPECENNDRLQKALCAVAWDEKLYSSETLFARALLLKNDRLENWMNEELKEQMKLWCKKHWDQLLKNEKGVIDKLFSKEKQRTLFFQNALPDKSSRSYISVRPENLAFLFEEYQTKEELANWLLKNVHAIMPETWINWVEFYHLYQFPRVTKQIGKLVNSDYHNSSFVATALKILPNSP